MNLAGDKKTYLAKGKTCWLTFWCFLLLLVTPGSGLAFLPGLEELIDDQSGEDASATGDDGQAESDSAPQNDFTPAGLEVAELFIPEEMVDDYFPTRAPRAVTPQLLRAAQPFGSGADWFKASTITPQRGGIRIIDFESDGLSYWLDLVLNLSRPELPLEIVNFGEGAPQTPFPAWSLDHSEIDFRLAEADILGPPPAFKFFNVGAGGVSYNLEFALTGADFTFAGIAPSGYVHYYPDADNPQVGFITDSPQAPTLSGNGLCFSGLKPSTPMTLFNVEGGQGRDYLNIHYCQGTVTQKFTIGDGLARGRYTPPGETTILFSNSPYVGGDQEIVPLQSGGSGFFSQPTPSQHMAQCIEDQTTLRVGLQRSNKLGESLVEVVTSFASALKLSNRTLNATKNILLDSRTMIADAIASGTLDGAQLSEFILKTLLKNATPSEHKAFVDKFFGNNVPKHVQNAAQTAGSAMEGQYKMALLGITQGLTEAFFPTASALAKSVTHGRQWAVEAMADEDIRNLYKLYREVNGRWDDFSMERVTRFRPNQSQRVGQILRNQGLTDTEARKDEFLKELFEEWYQQEANAPQVREELNSIRELYESDFLMRDELRSMTPGWSECDRLKRLADRYNQALLEIHAAMGDCRSFGRPPKELINQAALNMVRDELRPGTTSQRRTAWQQAKLQFLRNWDCLNYEEREEPPVDDPPEQPRTWEGDWFYSQLPAGWEIGTNERRRWAAAVRDEHAQGTPANDCVRSPYARSDVTVRLDPNRGQRELSQIEEELASSVRSGNYYLEPGEAKALTMGPFEGYEMTSEFEYRRGGWSSVAGYRDGIAIVAGAISVTDPASGNRIFASYWARSGACWNNSNEASATAATLKLQSEARSIINNLGLTNEKQD